MGTTIGITISITISITIAIATAHWSMPRGAAAGALEAPVEGWADGGAVERFEADSDCDPMCIDPTGYSTRVGIYICFWMLAWNRQF